MPTEQGPAAPESELSIAEVAARLGCSRPYLTMLCDKGELGAVVVTPEGHRRVLASAVAAYLARHAKGKSMSNLQQLAQDAGMYDIPEERYAGFVREPSETSSKDEKPSSA